MVPKAPPLVVVKDYWWSMHFDNFLSTALEKLIQRLQTDGHGDSMTNSAQWGRVGEKTVGQGCLECSLPIKVTYKWLRHPLLQRIVSVLGRDEGYTVKYTPCLKEFPRAKPGGIPEGEGVYLTVYPELSPNMDASLYSKSYCNAHSAVLHFLLYCKFQYTEYFAVQHMTLHSTLHC